jgi:hypothetical protein
MEMEIEEIIFLRREILQGISKMTDKIDGLNTLDGTLISGA